MTTDNSEHGYFPRRDFSRLLNVLRAMGYRCVGPVVRDGAITYEALTDIGNCRPASTMTSNPAATASPRRIRRVCLSGPMAPRR
jgi:hypothetical protein